MLTAGAAELQFAADLIILSASVWRGAMAGPVPRGCRALRAFIYAGARAILVLQWPLDDCAASQLTMRMLQGMYGGERL